jgi:hypothetical protein
MAVNIIGSNKRIIILVQGTQDLIMDNPALV